MKPGLFFAAFTLLILVSINLTAQSDTARLKIPSSATVLTLSGLNFNLYNSMPRQFQGLFSKPPYTMVQVKYPASLAKNSVSKGVEMLDAALKSTPGPKIVLAHSQGAQVCSRWMREHADDTTAPPPGELLFILTGNPLRSAGGYIIGRKEVGGTIGEPTPTNTPWRIIDVARRYDGWADWVQDEENKLAVRNANIGKQTLHLQYDEVDFFSPTHTIWTSGNTTYVLTREDELPVLKGSTNPDKIRTTRAQVEAAYSNRPSL
ncbi:MAG: PE-PPE domain-containing protein [Chitinophagaceae bacterium]